MASVMHSREKLTMLGEERKGGRGEKRAMGQFVLFGSVWRVGGGGGGEKMEATATAVEEKKERDPEP